MSGFYFDCSPLAGSAALFDSNDPDFVHVFQFENNGEFEVYDYSGKPSMEQNLALLPLLTFQMLDRYAIRILDPFELEYEEFLCSRGPFMERWMKWGMRRLRVHGCE